MIESAGEIINIVCDFDIHIKFNTDLIGCFTHLTE